MPGSFGNRGQMRHVARRNGGEALAYLGKSFEMQNIRQKTFVFQQVVVTLWRKWAGNVCRMHFDLPELYFPEKARNMPIEWASEACDRARDPESEAMLTQLTSSAMSSINIYCEQPYTSPDGNRVAIVRKADVSFDSGWRLIVADLKTLKLTMIESDGVMGIGNAAWTGQLHYMKADGTLWCVDLQTLEKRSIAVPKDVDLSNRGLSIAPNQKHIIYFGYVKGPTVQLLLVDLETQSQRVIFEHPEIINPHVQINPVHGEQILVQHNRGSKLRDDLSIERFVSELGTTHFVIDLDGGNMTPLPAGQPHTGTSTGHSNWVADTGRVCWAAHWNLQDWTLGELNKGGNIHTAAPGDAEATPFIAPEHRVNHVNVSKCGRYFVGDSITEGANGIFDDDGTLRSPVIVIGNLATGKYRTLVSRITAGVGGGQHQHLHVYFTADNRNVIYNDGSYTGPSQVWAARVPEGFLESLD